MRAVLAQSFEKLHRKQLVGMGILPLQFLPEQSALSLELSGKERFSIALPEGALQSPRQQLLVQVGPRPPLHHHHCTSRPPLHLQTTSAPPDPHCTFRPPLHLQTTTAPPDHHCIITAAPPVECGAAWFDLCSSHCSVPDQHWKVLQCHRTAGL